MIRSVRDLLRRRPSRGRGAKVDERGQDGAGLDPSVRRSVTPAGVDARERLPFTASVPEAGPSAPAVRTGGEPWSDERAADPRAGARPADPAQGPAKAPSDSGASTPLEDAYAARLESETGRFADEVEVHDLPPIYHYWSNTYLRLKLEYFGASGIDDYFANQLERAIRDAPEMPARFVSIGAGNCDTEVRVARLLAERGHRDFRLECVEITNAMVDRGREMAAEHAVADLVFPMRGDVNAWAPLHRYDAVLANQSLHHVVNLEGLFDAIDRCLRPTGRFVTSDMIGRNGHLRWPEALAIVQEFWSELPTDYRYHRQLRRREDLFLDWDCSSEGLEGIRAQDVLPLLLERFAFEDFLAFGNVIDPFIDRGFGPNFDAAAQWDRDFIDRVHERDEREIKAGTITPTHLIATMRLRSWGGPTRTWEGMSPESCVRRP
jgi:SAM-dependent methyltransferase